MTDFTKIKSKFVNNEDGSHVEKNHCWACQTSMRAQGFRIKNKTEYF